jgi:hypothetical protein
MPAKLSVLEWKARYLFGIPDTDPATSEPYPIEEYQYHLDLAYSYLTTLLDLPILPMTIVDERHDYYHDDYQNWAWLHLFQYPVLSITNIAGKFPQNPTAVTFPSEWAVVDKNAGHLQLVPTGGTISQFIIGNTGLFLPLLQRGGYIPGFWSIDYTAGFAAGQIPMEINDAVAKIAAMSLCNILGDLLGGMGVLGASIGLDGLSQFISMTKTATTSGFYARILQYRTELFGVAGSMTPGSQLHAIKRKYKGIKLINL